MSQEIDWEAVKLNLDRLTIEALSDIRDRIQTIILERQGIYLQRALDKELGK